MTPGYAKPRSELPWLPYEEQDRVIINAHNFGGTWTPAQISTSLWLDAADSSTLFDAVSGGSLVAANGGIARWQDKSGNARHFTQSTSGSRPARKTAIQNSLDVARFDGTADYLESTFAAFGSDYAVVAVASGVVAMTSFTILSSRSKTASNPLNPQLAVSNGVNFMSARSDAGSISFGQISGVQGNTWCLIGGDRVTNSVHAYLDGVAGSQTTATVGTTTTTVTTVGSLYPGTSTPGVFWSGDIGEIVVCGSANRVIVEGYMAHRWGTTSRLDALHPYKSAAP